MTVTTGTVYSSSFHCLPLSDGVITRVYFDYRFGIEFADSRPDLEIAVAAPFTLTTSDGVIELDPDQPQAMAPALALLRRIVDRVQVFDDGRLNIVFVDGCRLEAKPQEAYEAWTSASSDGSKFVCLPGGGLAIWGPHEWSAPAS